MRLTNYWGTTTSQPSTKWVRNLPDTADIVVFGAGGAGLTTALALALRGEEVVCLDALMPTWRNARKGLGAGPMFLSQLHKLHRMNFHIRDILDYMKFARQGMQHTLDFINKYGDINNNDDWCNFMQYGGFHLATTDAEEAELSEWKKYLDFIGVKPTIISANSTSQLTSLDARRPSLYVPNEFCVNPAKYYNGLTVACQKVGVQVLSGVHVTSATQNGFSWEVKDEVGNNIKCKTLIVCAGANLEALPESEELEDYITRKRIFYGATPEIVTDRLSPYVISTVDGRFVFRRYDNRMIVAFDDFDMYPADMKSPKHSSIRKARESLDIIYPINKRHKFDFVWSKNSLETKDSLPIICEVEDRKGLYLNIGYGIDSLPWQHIGASVIQELVLGSKPSRATELFSLERVNK